MTIPDYPIIKSFRGNYHWLSNFFDCPVYSPVVKFDSVEHGYQIMKFDSSEHAWLASNKDAVEMKRYAKKAKYPDKKTAMEVMEYLLRQKFEIPRLKALLIGTGMPILLRGMFGMMIFGDMT